MENVMFVWEISMEIILKRYVVLLIIQCIMNVFKIKKYVEYVDKNNNENIYI